MPVILESGYKLINLVFHEKHGKFSFMGHTHFQKWVLFFSSNFWLYANFIMCIIKQTSMSYSEYFKNLENYTKIAEKRVGIKVSKIRK